MKTLKQLRDRRAEILSEGQAIVKAYIGTEEGPTDEQNAALVALTEERSNVDAAIQREEARIEAERSFEAADVRSIGGGRERAEDDPKRGFSTFAEFAGAVMLGSRRSAQVDPRLKIGAAPTTTSNEGAGEDGGFLIPPQFSSQIQEDALEDDALLPLVDNTPVTGNGMTFPADETTPWGSSGVQAYWEGEGNQAAQSKLSLKSKTLRLNKLFALVPITEELGADASAVGAYVERRVAPAIRYKTNDALVNGDGVGKPLGVVGHGGTVSVAKTASQTAATINVENVTQMFSRCINPMRAIWIANISAFPQLFHMKDAAGNVVYQTASPGLSEQMDAMLLGRPLRFVEACPTLGTVGDLILGDWEQYQAITKAGGIQTATSMHLWFDYDVQAFRATFRVAGQPWRSAPITPAKGSATRGNFVTLATRA